MAERESIKEAAWEWWRVAWFGVSSCLPLPSAARKAAAGLHGIADGERPAGRTRPAREALKRLARRGTLGR